MPDDVVMEFEEQPTPVHRVCLDCAGESKVLDDDVQPPASPVEAWALMTCRGTADTTLWRWCSTQGEMTMPAQGLRVSFDRRKVPR